MNNSIDKIFNMNAPYVFSLFQTLILLIIVRLLSKFITFLFAKKAKKSKSIFLFHQRLNISLNIVSFIIIFVIWFPYLKNIMTIVSFVSAGITIALRELILNLFAGIYIKANKPFKLEDRISIDGVKGDVVLINNLSFKILEVGDRINGEQSSGLIINVPNSFIFSKTLKNYNTAFKYIWDEITIKLNLNADLEKNKSEIMDIISKNDIVEAIPKKMNREIKNASLDYRLYYNHLEPIIYTRVVDKHIELDLRF